MKIKNEITKPRKTTFGNIYAGDIFMYEDDLYIKIDNYDGEDNCVDIKCGDTGWLDEEEDVVAIDNAELIIK